MIQQHGIFRLLSPLFRKYTTWLVIGGGIWAFFFQPYTILEVWQMHQEKKRLRSEIEHYERQIDSMNQSLRRLDDPAYIEYIARTQYGMKRPNEIIFKAEDSE